MVTELKGCPAAHSELQTLSLKLQTQASVTIWLSALLQHRVIAAREKSMWKDVSTVAHANAAATLGQITSAVSLTELE